MYPVGSSAYYDTVVVHAGNYRDVIFDHRSDEDYITQIVEYQEGEEPDDAPDSAASMIRILRPGKKSGKSFYSNQ